MTQRTRRIIRRDTRLWNLALADNAAFDVSGEVPDGTRPARVTRRSDERQMRRRVGKAMTVFHERRARADRAYELHARRLKRLSPERLAELQERWEVKEPTQEDLVALEEDQKTHSDYPPYDD